MNRSFFILLWLLVASICGRLSAQDASYRISPDDRLKVSVFDEPELESEVSVARNGMVSLPLVNEVRVSGKTAYEAQLAIAEQYTAQQYLRSPQVTVTVVTFAANHVTILGQVGKPGVIEIPGGQTKIDLLTAIAGAGDFKGIANTKKVTITRNKGKADERTETHDVKDMMKGGGGKTIYLYPGDVVFVPQRII